MKTLTDEQLVERTCKQGDTGAYSELVKRYRSYVYGVVYSLVRDWSEAQDMTQEAFLLAYVKLADLRDAT